MKKRLVTGAMLIVCIGLIFITGMIAQFQLETVTVAADYVYMLSDSKMDSAYLKTMKTENILKY